MVNPYARPYLYKLFEQEGQDIIVRMPGHADHPQRFVNGEIQLPERRRHVQGAIGLRMIEQTYGKARYRKEKLEEKAFADPAAILDMDQVMTQIEGGPMPESMTISCPITPVKSSIFTGTEQLLTTCRYD